MTEKPAVHELEVMLVLPCHCLKRSGVCLSEGSPGDTAEEIIDTVSRRDAEGTFRAPAPVFLDLCPLTSLFSSYGAEALD